MPLFRFRHCWRHHAPLGGSFDVVARSGVLGFEGSFAGPSNTQMEPSRPTVLCDPVTAARGSFAPLARQRTKKFKINRSDSWQQDKVDRVKQVEGDVQTINS